MTTQESPSIIADRPPDVKEVHIVWMTTGLGCDGDSVSVTAASLPSIEEVVLGAVPGLPKVHLHNPVLAYESRRRVHEVSGSTPPPAGWTHSCWCSRARCRTRRSRAKDTGPPWAPIRRRASPSRPTNGSTAWRPRRSPSSAPALAPTYGGIHAMQGNPTGAMGLADYLGLELALESRPADRQRPRLPGAARQHDGDAALSPLPGGRPGADDPAGRPTAAHLAFRQDRARRLRPRRLLRAGRFRPRVRLAQMPGEDRLLGAGGELQRDQARMDGRHRRLPQCRRHLHRLHDARASPTNSCRSWTSRPAAPSPAPSSASTGR